MQLLAAAEPLLTPPDLRPLAQAALSTIATVGFAAVSSLMALLGSSGLTTELLETWARAGFLHMGTVELEPLSGKQVPYVALTTKGARELNATRIPQVEGVSPARLKRSSQKRAHDVAVGEVALAVLALADAKKIELAGLETDDKKFATSVVLAGAGAPPTRIALQADCYLVSKTPRGPSALLVEVDRGTISVKKMAEKYAGYLHWRREAGPERDFGLRALRVLTVVPDDRRLEKLHEAALLANGRRPSRFILFMRQADATAHEPARLLEPVCKELGGGSGHVPLFAS